MENAIYSTEKAGAEYQKPDTLDAEVEAVRPYLALLPVIKPSQDLFKKIIEKMDKE